MQPTIVVVSAIKAAGNGWAAGNGGRDRRRPAVRLPDWAVITTPGADSVEAAGAAVTQASNVRSRSRRSSTDHFTCAVMAYLTLVENPRPALSAVTDITGVDGQWWPAIPSRCAPVRT